MNKKELLKLVKPEMDKAIKSLLELPELKGKPNGLDDFVLSQSKE